jgi:hypothetical protein
LASVASCGLSYQERQDRFREHYLSGCEVRNPPASQSTDQEAPESPERTAIEDVISGAKTEVDQCYLESRELWSDLEGLVSIKLMVQPNGSVSDAAVVMYEATLHEPAVGCCITRGAKSWKFPTSKDGKPYEVEHTFDLVTDIFRFRYRPESDVGKPQPASGTAIHHTW